MRVKIEAKHAEILKNWRWCVPYQVGETESGRDKILIALTNNGEHGKLPLTADQIEYLIHQKDELEEYFIDLPARAYGE